MCSYPTAPPITAENVFDIPTSLTIVSTTYDCCGSGKNVVVRPVPLGHLNSNPDKVISYPTGKLCGVKVVTVTIPLGSS